MVNAKGSIRQGRGRAPGATHSLFNLRASAFLLFVLLLAAGAPAQPVPVSQRIMHWTPDQLAQVIADHQAATQMTAKDFATGFQPKDLPTSVNLYPLLSNIPGERNQGSCGNCWAWGSTGTLEIALNVQNGIRDRLSVQFLNSCDPYMNPCGGGGYSDFCRFYSYEGFAIPWSNGGAAYCGGGGNPTCIGCGSIATNPRYPIHNISYYAISTGSDQAASILNIKTALSQNKALYFFFYLPTSAAWSDFDNFFFNKAQNVVWNNFYCGVANDGGSGGHVVLCLGYYDDGGANRYWIMLNSWGVPSQRQTGLFYVAMAMDYTCGGNWTFGWQGLNVGFSLAPVITSQPASVTACSGGSTGFSISTAPGTPLTYQWQKNGTNVSNGGKFGGATSSALSISNVSTNEAGTYTVVLNYGNGTTGSAPAVLSVPVPPAILTQPQSQSICQGGTLSLAVGAVGTALSYQWQLNGANISATQSAYVFGNVHTNKSGNYTCVVSNSCGVVTSAVANVAVTLPLAITAQPQSQVGIQGANVAFCVTAAEGTAPAYQWLFNGAALSGASSCYSLGNIHANKAGAYTAVLSNGCGCLTSSVAWLTVLMPLSDQTATQGATARLVVTNYGGDPALTYHWQRSGTNLSDGGNITGAASPNLILSPLGGGDAGRYGVVVGNGVSAPVALGANLSVSVPPAPHIDSISFLTNGSVRLTVHGTPGCAYDLQRSTNWLNWASLCTTSSPDGCLQYSDPSPTQGGQGFYRLRLAP